MVFHFLHKFHYCRLPTPEMPDRRVGRLAPEPNISGSAVAAASPPLGPQPHSLSKAES
jgi:hypothetical protein